MSLIQQVAGIVRERGEASADDIQIEGKTRQQIIKALQNAAHVGLIHPAKARSHGFHKGRAPNVYGVVRPSLPEHVRRVSSVFALGAQ